MIKGLIFDLDSTLLHFSGDWPTVSQAGAEAMADWYLKKKHIKLDSLALIETFIAERAAGQALAEQSQTEVIAQQSLRETLKKIEAPATAGALVEAALKTFFEPEEIAWAAYPDAVETLKALQGRGYRLGLYANISDEPFYQRLVNRNYLRPWLSPVFSSAGWGWRKPRPEPFALIASRWGLPAQEIVVIGDTLAADILGAQQAGMPSILVMRAEAPAHADNGPIQPTAVADNLSALPDLIAHL